MEDKSTKIHKIETNSGRVAPFPAEERRTSEQVRYVVYDPSQDGEEDAIDLLALWRVLLDYKRVLATIFLAALALATTAAFLMTPVYRAELVMSPVVKEGNSKLSSLAGQFGGLASMAGVNLGSGNDGVEKILAILGSRAFLIPFMRQENIFKHLYPEYWDTKSGTWIVSSTNKSQTSLKAYKLFANEILNVKNDLKSGLVTLSVEWTDPELAAKWANRLVSRLNDNQRQFAISEAQRSIEYLNQQLKETRVVDMQQVIYRLIESQTKVIMLANVKNEYALQVIDPAVTPETKVRPKRMLMVVVGALLGLVGSFIVVFILNAVKNIRRQS